MVARHSWEFKLVVLVREDLKLSAGKLAAQVAHAAVSCALAARIAEKRMFKRWFQEGQRKVVLGVKDMRELEEFEMKARRAGFIVERITDAGLTEVPPGTVTCLGIGPGREDEIDVITGELKLA